MSYKKLERWCTCKTQFEFCAGSVMTTVTVLLAYCSKSLQFCGSYSKHLQNDG